MTFPVVVLLLAPILFAGPPQAGAQGADGPPASTLRPEVQLELRVRALTRELLLDPVQQRDVRRVLEDAQLLRELAAAGGREPARSPIPAAARWIPETSPSLPGVQVKVPKSKTHPSLLGLGAPTYLELLKVLDLRQTRAFIRLLGIPGLLELRLEALRLRRAMAGLRRPAGGPPGPGGDAGGAAGADGGLDSLDWGGTDSGFEKLFEALGGQGRAAGARASRERERHGWR